MIKAFRIWTKRPARWWQFWNPQSGTPGGFLAALVVIYLCALFSFLIF